MYLVVVFRKSYGLAYNDIITTHTSAWCNEPIIIQLIVHCITHAWKKHIGNTLSALKYRNTNAIEGWNRKLL